MKLNPNELMKVVTLDPNYMYYGVQYFRVEVFFPTLNKKIYRKFLKKDLAREYMDLINGNKHNE